MEEYHAEDATDTNFDAPWYATAVSEHNHWVQHLVDAESTCARAADVGFWRAFAADCDKLLAARDRGAAALPNVDASLFPAYIASNVTEEEVQASAAAGSAATAVSPADQISYMPFKHGGDAVRQAVALVCSMVLATGLVPSSWTCGYVNWLLKKGSPLVIKNFRGIVFTSCFGKIFEGVMLARLLRWIRVIRAVPTLQASTHRNGGTLEQISTLTDILEPFDAGGATRRGWRTST